METRKKTRRKKRKLRKMKTTNQRKRILERKMKIKKTQMIDHSTKSFSSIKTTTPSQKALWVYFLLDLQDITC